MYKYPLALSILTLAVGFIVATFIFAVPLYAQEDTVVFPIAELGDCENKEDCRDYCDDSLNMRACIAFAQTHKLMSDEEAELAEKFSDSLGGSGGPGGCTTPSDCQSYCEDITHINECLAFADKHGHVDEHIKDGRKIARYLSEGGLMPGNCTSRESCETYCNDFNHAEECFLFAEQVGLDIEEDDDGPGAGREHFRAMLELVKRGETPGGCTSRESCEAYCSVSEHIEECVVFGEKVGFISHEEAEIVRKTGGKGPGNCSSREECDTYCNNPANREMCFAFAKEHGLIQEDELRDIEEGVVHLRNALDTAPAEAVQCLKHNLGENVIDSIRSGAVLPGPQLADTVRACLERGFKERDEREFKRTVGEMPEEVRNCIEEKLGTDIQSAFTRENHSELEETIKSCFESSQPSLRQGPDGSQRFDGTQPFNEFDERGIKEEFRGTPPPEGFQESPYRDSRSFEGTQQNLESFKREFNERGEFHMESEGNLETFKEELPLDTRTGFTSESEEEFKVRNFETIIENGTQSSLKPNDMLGTVIHSLRQFLAQ